MVRSLRRLSRSGTAALLLSAASTTVLLLLALPASAQERAVALDKPRLAQAPEPYCFCWNDGKKIAEGSMACIRTTMGRRLATCGRVTNLMSWEVTENPCPES
jgi:hypothetical protein